MAGFIIVRGVRVPSLMYGTAWKEERTESLTALALSLGFRAVDTANQRKHYFEAGVGAAVAGSGLQRSELFLQTKFTYARGQDQRLPFDPHADFASQVRASFASSLAHLGVTTIDSYVLHGPWSSGWSREDRETWRAMEELHGEGKARLLGVSNVSLPQLTKVWDESRVPIAFVQNRCYARTGWDRAVRTFCADRGIVYQGFSLLTANARELESPKVHDIARRGGVSVAQLVFRFARAVGMLPLTGTTDRAHMVADLGSESLVLDPADLAALENVGA